MDKSYEQKYHDLESVHWWFKGRRDAVLRFFKDIPRDARILDVGCSSGHLLTDLTELGFDKDNLYGIDISEEGVNLARERGFKNCFVMDGSQPTFTNERFDVIISSDSLEHMEFDERALKNWFELLNSNGTLMVFVPAFMFLWSDHDEVNHHFRRYTASSLSDKIKAAGFNVSKKGYWNSILFPLIAGVRMTQKLLPGGKDHEPEDDLKLPSGVVNKALSGLLGVENAMIRTVTLPFGVSTFCIAKKL